MEQINFTAQCNNINKIKNELESGVDVNATDDDGYTLLHWACQEGDKNVVEFLLRVGADFNKRDKDGFHALEIASTKGYIDIVKLLIDNGADIHMSRNGFTAVHAAAASCHNDIVDLFIRCGANIHIKDDDGNGRLPLHWAIQEGCIDVVKILIKNGADIDCRENGDGYTPLNIAVSEGYNELVSLLISSGADVNAKFYCNTTALHTACAWERTEIVALLLENNANPFVKDSEGKTPLDIAIEVDNKIIIKLLEEAIKGLAGS